MSLALTQSHPLGSTTSARLRAAGIHFLVSALIGAALAFVVLRLWFPHPFEHLAGGWDLFWIVLGVDVVLGPLVTLVVFDPRKPRRSLARDISVVALVQLAALAYGIHTVSQVRPTFLALERDRVRVVRPVDLDPGDLDRAPARLRHTRATGFVTVATRPVKPEEVMEVASAALAGRDIATRPEFWLPPEQTAAAWAAAGLPMSKLRDQHRSQAALIDAAVARTGLAESNLKYLAIIARESGYVILIDGMRGNIVGYAPVDGN